MKHHEISVAIPAYNRADYLKETLDAIINQIYPASEIIVVTDGSSDHTTAVLDNYSAQIKSIRIENSGATIARKIASEASKQPWQEFIVATFIRLCCINGKISPILIDMEKKKKQQYKSLEPDDEGGIIHPRTAIVRCCEEMGKKE